MKVSEMIERLKQANPDAVVVIDCEDCYYDMVLDGPDALVERDVWFKDDPSSPTGPALAIMVYTSGGTS